MLNISSDDKVYKRSVYRACLTYSIAFHPSKYTDFGSFTEALLMGREQ